MKYEYAIQKKWKEAKKWNTMDIHFDSIKQAKDILKNHKKNSMRESRIVRRVVSSKWEVVK